MRFKVIIAMVEQERQDEVISSAKDAGATGVTILNARGEGIREQKTFFGLQMDMQREVLLFIVEDFHANSILDAIYKAGNFEKGRGMAFSWEVTSMLTLSWTPFMRPAISRTDVVWHSPGQLTGSSERRARWRP